MRTKKNMPPVDISLPELELLQNGTMFVRLRTLNKLEDFWQSNRGLFKYACVGRRQDEPKFLREYEWVFGQSKSSVVHTVLRWGESGVSCEYHGLQPSGCWLFKNLPDGYDPFGWFDGHTAELSDPSLPIAEVEKALLEMTFNDWMNSGIEEIEFHDHKSLEDMIDYYRVEKATGEDFYGKENESD